jgi:hypothetical protein
MSNWKNRITGSGSEKPDQLLANPKNWRIHPITQQEAVEAALDEVGWVQQVIVNKTTGHLVDGHLRVALAISREEPEIPVTYVELSEEEEALVLATLDPLAGLAATDAEKLSELLEETNAEGQGLQNLLDDLASSAKPYEDLVNRGEVANDEDFWPVIRLQVSPDTYRRWAKAWEEIPGENDDERVASLIEGIND